jgi:Bacterial SH3 domain
MRVHEKANAAHEVLPSQRAALQVFREAERTRTATDLAIEEVYSAILNEAADAAAVRRNKSARALQQVETTSASAVDAASHRRDAGVEEEVGPAVRLANEARDHALPALERVGMGWPAQLGNIDLPHTHHVTAELRAAVDRAEVAVEPLIDAVGAAERWGKSRNSLIKLSAVVTTGLLVAWGIMRTTGREHDSAAVTPESSFVITDTTAVPPAPVVIATTTGDPAELTFNLPASIQDPDGFTNVRRAPSVTSDVIARVYEGEVFYTFRQGSNWWQVRTRERVVGYMHVSRIHLISGP